MVSVGQWMCLLHLATLLTACFKLCKSSREWQKVQIWNQQTPFFNNTKLNSYINPVGVNGCTKRQDKRRNFQIIPSRQIYHVKYIRMRESNQQSLYDDILTHLLRNGVSLSNKQEKRGLKKQRVFIYGKDDRKPITSMQLRQFPFFNVVRLSSGCTGTLLTPSYVLTAAHCVHDGHDFKPHMEMLKIQVPHKTKYRIHYAREIVVPHLWLKSSEVQDFVRIAYDYAVIKLNIGVAGRQAFMPLHIPTNDDIRTTKLYFLGFPFHSDLLWLSKCPGWSSVIICRRNILLNKCDSTTGNSGSALYTEDTWRSRQKIIGILSSTNTAQTRNSARSRYTTFSLLTRSKVDDICTIISPEGTQYGVCSQYNHRSAPNKVLFG